MIESYFEEIEKTIYFFRHMVKAYSVNKKIYSSKLGYINGIIHFVNNTKLHFTEVKNTESFPKVKYSYHYMGKQDLLIFRYDNAEHHREVSTFPHHKHTLNSIGKSKEPLLEDILREIQADISRK